MYHALHHGKPGTGVITHKWLDEDVDEDGARIRCPMCEWKPGRASKWFCGPCDIPEGFRGGCGMSWNTFTTRGRCPGCNHQWRWTSCLACGQWSLHEDWYQTDDRKPT
jgi:hypothetical protein